MLNHIWIGPESSRIKDIRTAAVKGNVPNIKLIILYFPVRCIIHLVHSLIYVSSYAEEEHAYPANSDPHDIETLFGSRWNPIITTVSIISEVFKS